MNLQGLFLGGLGGWLLGSILGLPKIGAVTGMVLGAKNL